MEGIEIIVGDRNLVVKEWTVDEMRAILQEITKSTKDAKVRGLSPDADFDVLLNRVKENVISGIDDYGKEKSRFISKVWVAILQANSGVPLESEKTSKEPSLQAERPAVLKVPK